MCFHAESDPALLGLFDFRSAYKSLVDVSKGFEFETSDSLSRNPPSLAPFLSGSSHRKQPRPTKHDSSNLGAG
ncbi:MAG: hypothetical protein EBW88_11465 [Betaproteobacteria bacterium]|nr:hypothetical protein [Betaproteobacteria bacterium]NCX73974.1 hypothetical protein [Betaproteobacteria bacterium]